MTRILVGALVLGLLGSFVFAPVSSGAAEAPAWTLKPTATPAAGEATRSLFAFQVTPGQTIDDSVTLYNPTDDPVQIDLFPSDAFTVARGGGFALNTSQRPTKDAGAWVKLPVTQFSAPAKTGVKIPFQVVVPADASPGDHSAGIVALGTAPVSTTTSGGVTVQAKRAVGTRIYVDVAGPRRPKLDISSLSLDAPNPILAPVVTGGSTTVDFTLANTGNVRLSPKVRVWLTDVFGRTVKTFPTFQVTDLLPGNETKLSRTWSSSARLPILLTAHVEATAPKASTSASTGKLIVPWLLLVIVLALVVLAIVWWRRRRKTDVDPYAELTTVA